MYSTRYNPPPPGLVDSLVSGTLGTWQSLHRFAVNYWWNAWRRGATPFGLAEDLVIWSVAIANRERPPWAHEHRIVKEWPIARLRDYSTEDAAADMVATVILPPQAGHDSSIVDFNVGQSQIVTGRENGCHRIFALDWVGATQETKDTGIDDYMALLREVADLLGGKVNLVGDCQGGWLATIFTALYPEKVNSLAIAGAPIDFHAGEPLIHDWLNVLAPDGDMSFFRSAVESNNGVLPGRFLLDGFKMMQPDQELSRRLELLNNLGDAEHTERYRKFENWFQWTQAMPGAFYLWVVEHLFMRNSLIKGELVVEGRTVDLAAIECPLFLMAGRNDHITPADQVWALADYASTPAARIGRQSSKAGHLGLFMSHESLRKHWTAIFEEMGALSTPTPKDSPDVLTDEPTDSEPSMWGQPGAATAAEQAAPAAPKDDSAQSRTASQEDVAPKDAEPKPTTSRATRSTRKTTGTAATSTARTSPASKAAPAKAKASATRSTSAKSAATAAKATPAKTSAAKTSTTKASTTKASSAKSSTSAARATASKAAPARTSAAQSATTAAKAAPAKSASTASKATPAKAASTASKATPAKATAPKASPAESASTAPQAAPTEAAISTAKRAQAQAEPASAQSATPESMPSQTATAASAATQPTTAPVPPETPSSTTEQSED